MSRAYQNVIFVVVLSFLVIYVYWRFIFYADVGVSDDAMYLSVQDEGWGSLLKRNLLKSGHASRPLYALVQVVCLKLFGAYAPSYHLLKLILWFGTVWNLFRFQKKYTGLAAARLTLVFGLFPFFITGLFQSSFQMGYLLAGFFWSLSILQNNQVLVIVLMALSLLSCEIIYPLFVLNLFVLRIDSRVRVWWRKYLGFSALIVGFLVFKFFITPLYQDYDQFYGLSNEFDLSKLLEYAFSIIVLIPILAFKSFFHSNGLNLILIGVLVFALFMVLGNSKERQVNQSLFFHILLGVVVCGSVFVLSGYPADTFGHYNKMLMPFFIYFVLFMGRLLQRKKLWMSILIAIPCLLSMKIQLDNFVSSSKLRSTILEEIDQKLENEDQVHLVANVPFFLDNNYNNEHVFWLKWDLKYGLKHSERVIEAFPVNQRILSDPNYLPYHNLNNFIDTLKEVPVMYFKYDCSSHTSESIDVRSLSDLRFILAKSNDSLNNHELILEEHLKVFLKNVIR